MNSVATVKARRNPAMLSSSVSVEKYLELENEEDRKTIAKFIIERFEERYFDPIDKSSRKHGFSILAVSCLAIETLESFYQGLEDTKNKSRLIFRDFFERFASLNNFGKDGDWFFVDIRCGILHQSETRDGWRIARKGPLLDRENKVINATKLLRELKIAVRAYAEEIQISDKYWNNFKKKMKSVCSNCESRITG